MKQHFLGHKSKKGLSLLEVLMATIILACILAATLNVLNVGNNLWRAEMVLANLQQQTRLAIDGMSREIRQSSNITNPAPNSSGSQIDFSIPGVTDAINYYLTGDQITREHPSAITRPLATSISALTFSRTGNVVDISVTASRTFKNRYYAFSLKEKVRVRN